jgi:hypothetical protein
MAAWRIESVCTCVIYSLFGRGIGHCNKSLDNKHKRQQRGTLHGLTIHHWRMSVKKNVQPLTTVDLPYPA